MSQECTYCLRIAQYDQDYPIRQATVESMALLNRCPKHWQYVCDNCGAASHFSSVGWLEDAKRTICLRCATETRVIRERFWYYDYYYCFRSSGGEWGKALDRLEFEGKHPLDMGYPMQVGEMPSSLEERPTPNKRRSVECPDEVTISRFWTANSSVWNEQYGEFGDPLRECLLPLDDIATWLGDVSRVLDAGCGAGYLSRLLASVGIRVVGVDNSTGQIRLARQILRRSASSVQQAVEYYEGSLTDLSFLDREPMFDGIVCITALENIPAYGKAVHEMGNHLKQGGHLVLAVIHPCFSMRDIIPRTSPIDSARFEDVLWWEISDYFSRGVSEAHYGRMPAPTITFHRTLEDYSEALHAAGFVIMRLLEPEPTLEQVDRYPDLLGARNNRIPRFLVFVARKEKTLGG